VRNEDGGDRRESNSLEGKNSEGMGGGTNCKMIIGDWGSPWRVYYSSRRGGMGKSNTISECKFSNSNIK